ncbi:hypothetical protein LINPERHAP1_LOCUS6034 [Linum perenne]
MSRTDWLVPIDSFHPHEQKPSFNSMFGSLVRENRRKNHPIAIRDHPLDKMSNQSLARLCYKMAQEVTKAIFPSDSSSGTDRQVNRLGICSFAGISWTSSGSPEFLKACRSSGSRDGVSAIERVP